MKFQNSLGTMSNSISRSDNGKSYFLSG